MNQTTQDDKILFGQCLNLAYEESKHFPITVGNEINPEWQIKFRATVKELFSYAKELRKDNLGY